MTLGRWLALAVLVAAGVFALTGGVWPLAEYRRLGHREAEVRVRIDSINRELDSLQAFRDSLLTDPRVQERVARARAGMIRPGEIAVLLLPERPAVAGDSAP
jgi:hypothetical protein